MYIKNARPARRYFVCRKDREFTKPFARAAAGAEMRKISLRRFLAVHTAAAAVVAAYIFLPFGCPIKYFLHINCPACGSTRALVALLKGDTASYFFYNPIALPLLLIVLFALHKELFGLSRRTESLILIPSAAVVIVVYIFRLIFMQ